jgi:hypothetical protein
VKLQKPENSKKKTSLLQDIKEAWKEFIGGVNEASGLDTPEIIEYEINRYQKAERLVFNKVTTRLKADPVTEERIKRPRSARERNW